MGILRVFSFLLPALVIASPCGAGRFEVTPVFSSDMILQREKPIQVWGTARDGMDVSVSFGGEKYSGKARDGQWKVVLPSMPASGQARTMVVQATGEEEIRFDNVVVGDVWFASGQSNMEMPLRNAAGGEEAIAAAKNRLIRHYKVPRPDPNPPVKRAVWQEASPESITHQSALGYFFVKELQPKLGIPVGLLHCSYGGTPTEVWCGPEVMSQDWPAWQGVQKRMSADPNIQDHKIVNSYLYEHMVKPVMPFPVKGILWYQGEANAGRAEEQKKLLPAMVADWRKTRGDENLPFYLVQLARYEASDWHDFRMAQFDCWKNIPNSHMVVTIDLPKEPGDHPIHPKAKAEIGHRLALASRALVYDESGLVYSGPVLRSIAAEDDSAMLSFNHVGGGLASLDGKPLRGFYLSADGKTFLPGTARIVGPKVRVSSPDVPRPTHVRYGAEADMGKKNLDVNLGNHEGLPASPFTAQVADRENTSERED